MELIQDYFAAKRSGSKPISERTEVTYRDHLRPFLEYWPTHIDDHQHTISRSTLDAFDRWLRNDYRNSRGGAPAENTISHCLIVLKQIFEWMYQSDCTDGIAIQKWVPAASLVEPDVYFPETEALQKLIDTITQGDSVYRTRDMAIVTFGLSTGARASEIAFALAKNVTFVDAPLDDLRLSQEHRGYVYLARVKGDMDGRKNRGRYVVFDSKAGLLLKCWLKSYVPAPEATIFNFQHGHGIYMMIARYIKKMGEEAGEAEALNVQSLRRAFSDNWDEELGTDKRAPLKLQMGHSMRGDVTQMHYIDRKKKTRNAKQLMEVHVSPLSKLCIDWSRFPVICDKKSS